MQHCHGISSVCNMTDRDPPFPRFSGKAEDWPSFKTKAKALLTYKHANILNAVPTDASQLATYQAASTWLFLQLILYVEGAAAEVVQPFDGNGAGAWLALHDKYEAVSIARQAQLQAEVTNATLKDDEDPDLHFLRLEESRRQLAAQGITLQDDFIRNVVLEHLTSKLYRHPAHSPCHRWSHLRDAQGPGLCLLLYGLEATPLKRLNLVSNAGKAA